MLSVYHSHRFKKSFEKLRLSGSHKKEIVELEHTVDILSKQTALPVKYCDHKLTGEYEGYRECHIKDDLLLVYQIKEKELILLLLDVGSHSYLFGN
ncbi:MAG: type II toxin-antitoxin system YafQ family toxin [Patescibacteria group bacterium]